jgi:uncharacterized membrane protein YccC
MPIALKKLPVVLNPGAVSLAEGLRAGIAVALTMIAGAVLHLPHYGLAALGALMTCYADPGGPIAQRRPAVLAFALLAGIAYGVFGLVRAHGVWVAAPVAGLVIFAACYARIYGQAGMQVGNLLSVVIVLALDTPAYTIAQAAERALNFFGGALWAALLTLVIWQVHPYAPARRAVAEVSVKLARLVRDLSRLANADESFAAFAAHAAEHRRGVRDSIEAARNVALQTFRRRGLVSRRATQLTIRLQSLEQIFSGVIALSEILESRPPDQRAAMAKPLRLIGGWLAAIGPDIIADRALDTPRKALSLQRLREEAAKLPAESGLRRVLEAIAERLAVVVTASAPAGIALQDAQDPLPPWRRVIGPIRNNFTLRSLPMRHALRAGCVATPVLLFTLSRPQPFAHWAAITMVLCLQPYFSATWLRTAERIIGTALGGVLAGLIGLVAQTRLELACAMLPLSVFAFAVRGVSYTVFIAALTPMIVLLIEQLTPGLSETAVALYRVAYTLLGGMLAVLANAFLWPDFESGRVEPVIAGAIKAHADYAKAVFGALLDNAPLNDAPRRAAGLASNNLEATLTRALLEPHRPGDTAIARGAVVDAALRRMAGRLTVMLLNRPVIPPAARALWQDWRDWIVQGLTAGPSRPRPPLPDGPPGDALARLARQVELIAG